ncbi:Peptidyl-tRNA hydrolase [Actinidia chinensis var. chinensis]|uniref:peptidyl-tRNA hydrolase n=1 Tax=Actinidia chinensis var. chinensis TaxID=1590841 RepID=A0A2R6PU42_ACTCC|nr:Peptidyl-tRNA hydrolase [Actinidia chinensis var. chinensis]
MNAIGSSISASSSSIFSAGAVRLCHCRLVSSSKPLISTHWNKTTKAMSAFSLSSAADLSTSASATTASPSEPKAQPWLIVGLGNPGKMYSGTRHNVGFEMVDAIAAAEGISMSSVTFKALFGKGFIGNVPVMLAKPQTFMNASGESVGAIVSYYKIPMKQVLVIFDDLDLPFAKLRLLPKGGHGGHNGMRSVIDRFKGNRDFPRLRIGIGRPPGKMDAVNFVLRPFNKQEQQELDFTFQNGLEAVRILLLEGFNKSATFVNSAKYLEQLG